MPEEEELIKPWLDAERARSLVKSGFGLDAESFTELESYDDRNFRVRLAEGDPELTRYPHGLVLKVTNWKESMQTEILESVCRMLAEVSKTITCQTAVRTKDGKFFVTDVFPIGGKESPLRKECAVRLFHFLPGRTLHNERLSPGCCVSWGSILGRFHLASRGLEFPALLRRCTPWSLFSVPEIKPLVDSVLQHPEDRVLVRSVLKEFEEAQGQLRDLPRSILHGDLNEQNVLTGPEDDEVRAILDWGDVHGGPRLFDVAVMLTYVLIAPTADRSPWHNVALALAGYLEHSELERRDVALLKVLIASRLCQSLLSGLYTYQRDPGNDYVLYTQQGGWTALRQLWAASDEELGDTWNSVLRERGLEPLPLRSSSWVGGCSVE